MITVTFKHGETDALDEIIVKGHAGYAEAGQDIVCAAVSVLTITLINGLEAVAGIQELHRETRAGYSALKVPRSDNGEQALRIDTLIRTYEMSVRQTAEAYPEYMSIIDE